MSRTCNVYESFRSLCAAVRPILRCKAMLDGQTVIEDGVECRDSTSCYADVDAEGRGDVFDVLWLDGIDLRDRPPIERKHVFHSIVPEQPLYSCMRSYIERNDVELLSLTCEPDLEGIVAKLRHG